MSKYQGLRHFSEGISGVSQWTGKEVKQMQQVLICVIASLINEHVLAAMRGLLDFIYYAQYHSHTDIILSQMQMALNTFHANKDSFIELGVHDHFNIPKIHSMLHYIQSIQYLGSTDGFNTEYPEQLHIDYAKKAYHGSSRSDYIAQMTVWLQWQDAVDCHHAFLDWNASQSNIQHDEVEGMYNIDGDQEPQFVNQK